MFPWLRLPARKSVTKRVVARVTSRTGRFARVVASVRSWACAAGNRFALALLVFGALCADQVATYGQSTEASKEGAVEAAHSAQLEAEGFPAAAGDSQVDRESVHSADVDQRFNDIRSEFLDRQAGLIGNVLTMMAVLMAIIGLFIPIIGLLAYFRLKGATDAALSQVKKVADEASASSQSAVEDARKARDMVQQITTNLREAREHVSEIQRMRSDAGQYSPNLPGDKPESPNPIQEEVAILTTREILDRALKSEKEDRPADAVRRWRSVAEAAERDNNLALAASAWSSSAYILATLDPEAAIRDYSKAISLDAGNARWYYNRGTANAVLGRHLEALEDFAKSIELDPDSPLSFYNRGNSMVALHRYEEAISDFSAAIERDPNMVFAWVNRGSAKNQIGRAEEALDDFNKVIELRPDDDAGYFNRGTSKARCRHYEEAIADYTAAIKRNSNHALAYFCRGNCKADLGRHEDAIIDFTKAIHLDPSQAKSYFNRGVSKTKLGQIAEARNDFAASDVLRGAAGP